MKINKNKIRKLIQEAIKSNQLMLEDDTGEYDDTGGYDDTGFEDEDLGWIEDREMFIRSLKSRWWPRVAKKNAAASSKGAYTSIWGGNAGDGWFVTPNFPNGIKEEYGGRNGWIFWKMTMDGIYFTPSTDSKFVGDWDDGDKSEGIEFVPMSYKLKLPSGVRVNDFQIDELYVRWEGRLSGIGVEGSASATVMGFAKEVDGQQNALAHQREIIRVIREVVNRGSSRLSLTVSGMGLTGGVDLTWG